MLTSISYSPRISGYELYCPLLATRPANLTAKQARANFDYLIASIPERLEVLRTLLSGSGIRPDPRDGPVSFEKIGRWFQGRVDTRPKGADELAAQRAESAEWARDGLLRWELDDTTLSLCFDIGMYLGHSLIARNGRLKWELCKSGKTMTDYNWPVIYCLDRSDRLEPVWIARIQAYRAVQPPVAEDISQEFARLYNFWEERLGNEPVVAPKRSAD